MTRFYLITVGDKYVASPYADCLTDDRNKAGVFTDLNIDAVFSRWDKETDGKADIIETDWK